MICNVRYPPLLQKSLGCIADDTDRNRELEGLDVVVPEWRNVQQLPWFDHDLESRVPDRSCCISIARFEPALQLVIHVESRLASTRVQRREQLHRCRCTSSCVKREC
mgnify:CR=1 FL=1